MQKIILVIVILLLFFDSCESTMETEEGIAGFKFLSKDIEEGNLRVLVLCAIGNTAQKFHRFETEITGTDIIVHVFSIGDPDQMGATVISYEEHELELTGLAAETYILQAAPGYFWGGGGEDWSETLTVEMF